MHSSKITSAKVFYNGKPAGTLLHEEKKYRFTYDEAYVNELGNRPISITMPLRKEPYESKLLFPVFVNMLSEGANKHIQSRMLRIDENDYFSLLLATANEETIGPITIKALNEPS